MKAKTQALFFETANPCHAADWHTWKAGAEAGLIPEDKIMIPGVLDTTTNFVETPQLVADRLIQYAEIFGKERVMAGSDCGFGTFAGFGAVHPSICWAKLGAMAEGARIASEKLWGGE